MPSTDLRLVADIGGTNARFALVPDDGTLHALRSIPTQKHPSLFDAVRDYLANAGQTPNSACFAVAGPAAGDRIALTNLSWDFSVTELREALGLQALRVINDFEAVALAVPSLGGADLFQVGGTLPVAGRPKSILGPGTGLGVAQLVSSGRGFLPVATEGGHATIGASDEAELAILAALLRGGHGNSRETLLSGPGLERIYRILCRDSGVQAAPLDAPAIQSRAVEGSDPTCTGALQLFCAFLGIAAGDQALCCGAEGGVYIAGGIVRRFTAFLAASRFRARFEDKGPMRSYMQRIPAFVILAENPGLLGAARAPLSALEGTR